MLRFEVNVYYIVLFRLLVTDDISIQRMITRAS